MNIEAIKLRLGFDPAHVVRMVGLTVQPTKKPRTYIQKWRAKNRDKVNAFKKLNRQRNLAKGLTIHGKPRIRAYRPRKA